MAALALDTLRVSKQLREAGFSEPQADAVTSIIGDARETSLVELATKADLRELKSELKADIAEVRTDLKVEIAGVKASLLLLHWMGGVLVAGVAALILKSFFI